MRCGAIESFILDFIDCGLDILQSLQPLAKEMDHSGIKRKYCRYICFQGGIDIQGTMPFGGGYILCTAHNMQADAPVESVITLYNAAERYGFY